jgi:hypothetical protein
MTKIQNKNTREASFGYKMGNARVVALQNGKLKA